VSIYPITLKDGRLNTDSQIVSYICLPVNINPPDKC